jgi:hypothetical protein
LRTLLVTWRRHLTLLKTMRLNGSDEDPAVLERAIKALENGIETAEKILGPEDRLPG